MAGWIMCDAGIYPAGKKYDPEEDPEPIEVLILEHHGRMHVARYLPEGYSGFYSGQEPAYWETEGASWQLEDIMCWRHLPALPPGTEVE